MQMEMECYPACCNELINGPLLRLKNLRKELDHHRQVRSSKRAAMRLEQALHGRVKACEQEVKDEFHKLHLNEMELRALCKYAPGVQYELTNLDLIGKLVTLTP
jgi:hypothetical protein